MNLAKMKWVDWIYPVGFMVILIGMWAVSSGIFSIQEKPEEGYTFEKMCFQWNQRNMECNYIDGENGICYFDCFFGNMTTITPEILKESCNNKNLDCLKKIKVEKLTTQV